MPTSSRWISDDIYLTSLQAPVTRHELNHCMTNIIGTMTGHPGLLHLIFDMTNAGANAYLVPVLILEAGLLRRRNAGKVVFVGEGAYTRLLASAMNKVTQRDMVFFETQFEALHYCQGSVIGHR